MIDLTAEQRHQLDCGQAVEIADAQTAQSYVLLRRDVYDRVCGLLYDDTEWSADELRHQLARAAQGNGWNEPDMAAYDRYDEELRKQCS